MVEEKDLTGEKLIAMVEELLAQPGRLAQMEQQRPAPGRTATVG